jgi:predicted ABC-type ATPase
VKEYIIFAGVNGAGKTTLYELKKQPDIKRVNPDEILMLDGKDWRDSNNVFVAMRKSVCLINDYFSDGRSFCQETTLTGKTVFKHIRAAKSSGYYIKMHYVGLESVDLSIKRVAERVQKGGHGIDEDVLRRRYSCSLDNLRTAVLLCDEVLVYDNSDMFRLIASFNNGEMIIRKDNGILWFSKLFPDE